MAQPRLVKKRLALYIDDSTVSVMTVFNLYTLFLQLVFTYISNHRVNGDIFIYPLTDSQLRKLSRVEKINGYWVIGIRTEGVNSVDQELFNKLVDIEYGNSGKEIRVITRALEQLIISTRKEVSNVSEVL